ncbi:hypothetical protein [Winogradskyella maritima]|uniref:Lipoprotein n=1 Tax=Winogradskyella maritima TaxID=1517766 RepID=A0ABV8AEY2_9FLAO
MFFIFLVLTSCVNSKETKIDDTNNSEPTSSEKEISNDKNFEIEVKMRSYEDENITLFYTSSYPEEKFNGDKVISKNIDGRDSFQTIMFSLPENEIPFSIRLDFGNTVRKNIGDVDLEYIKMSYSGKAISIIQDSFPRYFQHNGFMKYTESGYSRFVVDGNYDPFIISNDNLYNKIESEL